MGLLRNLLHSLRAEHTLSLRHQPSPPDRSVPGEARSIDEYLAQCRLRVEQARTDLEGDDRDWIIDGNSPFFLEPETPLSPRRGILMVHGLTDSPFLMRDLAAFFQQQGYSVLAIQLPGHGTRPGDLLNIRWQDWFHAQRQALDLLAREVDSLYLLGFSAGATLNLYQALQDPRIRALFLFSPAIKVRSLARLACPLSRLSRWSAQLGWFAVQPDDDSFKYESLANRAICEAWKMVQALHRMQSVAELKVPLFVAASEDDATIDSPAILRWFERLQVPKRMLYYCREPERAPAFVRAIDSRCPERNIRSYSHTALLHPPANPHYGENGRYTFCTHYYLLNPEKYRRCKAGQEDCLGEMFGEEGDCRVVRRLTYNPFYPQMLDEISAFLDLIESEQENQGKSVPAR